MKKGRLGFTLIEVAIFLAISGALFVGVAVGVQTSIYQQRQNDTVQNFMEFLRGVYDGVTNVQNNNSGGNTEQAIYGKLVTFGESTNLAGEQADNSQVFVYTVVGAVNDGKPGSVLTLLDQLGANIAEVKSTVISNNNCAPGSFACTQVENTVINEVLYAGYPESYTPRWAAQIEPACDASGCDYNEMTGMLLIVRHPNSGVVYTYFTPDVVQVNGLMNSGVVGEGTRIPFKTEGVDGKNYLLDKDPNYAFKEMDVDFCLNATGEAGVTNRADIRIVKGARNASGIELVGDGTEGYRCWR